MKTTGQDKVLKDPLARVEERKDDALRDMHEYEVPDVPFERNMTPRSTTSRRRWKT